MIPESYVSYLRETFGETDANRFLEGLSLNRAVTFRINPVKTNVQTVLDFLEEAHIPVQRIAAFEDVFVCPSHYKAAITSSSLWEKGGIYIQNPSSMLAAFVVSPKPDESVLDLTAAPGSKTQLMSVLMKNSGRIAAVEIQRDRFFRMKQNLATCGTSNTVCYQKDGTTIGKLKPNAFDRVLLDAPCSSESFIGTENEEAGATWSLKKVKSTVQKQKMLAYSAFQALKPGGRLVYATCTLNPLENEEMVSYLLNKFTGSLKPERIDWISREKIPLVQTTYSELAPESLRILPGAIWDGFFIACFRKSEAFS